MYDIPPSNELLAEVYRKEWPQTIVVFPLVWRHEIGGDWFLYGIINNGMIDPCT